MQTTFKDFLLEELNMPKFIGYHITSKRYLKSIYKKGLIPKVPEDFGEHGDIEGVYLFKTVNDAENALFNWFGERIEEWEEEHDKTYDEVVLTINLAGLENYLLDTVEYEWCCTTTIEPNRIIEQFEATEKEFEKRK